MSSIYNTKYNSSLHDLNDSTPFASAPEYSMQSINNDAPIVALNAAPPIPLFLYTFVNEAGLDAGGTFAATDLESQAISGLPAGWSVVGAGSTTVDYGHIVNNAGIWQFTLTQAISHPAGASVFSPTAQPTVRVRSDMGVEYEASLAVSIMDDAPRIQGQTSLQVDGGDSVAGLLLVSYGADGRARLAGRAARHARRPGRRRGLRHEGA